MRVEEIPLPLWGWAVAEEYERRLKVLRRR
jgi:hypothetical protein